MLLSILGLVQLIILVLFDFVGATFGVYLDALINWTRLANCANGKDAHT